MTTQFPRGKIMGPEDLALALVDQNDNPVDAYQISYAIYQVKSFGEVPIGPTNRSPVHTEIGLYYASFQIPENADLGLYRIRWSFQQTTTSPVNMVVEEFNIVEASVFERSLWSPIQSDMIRRLRILLRDNCPDRNYHFRPPTSEGTLSQKNRAFSFIWTDEELIEYMERGVDFVNLWPPLTTFKGIDGMVKGMPQWRQMILMAAIAHAAMALAFNWVAEEFSLAGDELVTVYLPTGGKVILSIEELFEVCYSDEDTPYTDVKEAFWSGHLQTLSVLPSGEVVKRVVSDVMQHKTGHKRMVRVTTESGKVVTCTEDHSIFGVNPSGLPVPYEAGSLSVGDVIVTASEIQERFTSEKITSIVEVPAHPVTYDLCVPGPENFVLSSGILAHNSYSIGGVSLDISKSSQYESLKGNAESQLDKMLEAKTRTVKITRGLRQSRYGVGVRSSFGGPYSNNTLTPSKYLGF